MQIVKLGKSHQRKQFDCGTPVLNRFLQQQAGQLIKRGETVVYVICDEQSQSPQNVLGFYTLSTCQIEQAIDPQQLSKQSPYTPIPCVLIGRLAVDKTQQGKGLGRDLLSHALVSVARLAESIGIAYVIVDAKDNKAKAYYQRFGFIALQHEPLRLCYSVRKIQQGLL